MSIFILWNLRGGVRGLGFCGFRLFLCAVLRFSPIFSAVFVRFCGFCSSVRFAFCSQNKVRFFGFWPFWVAVLRFLSFENSFTSFVSQNKCKHVTDVLCYFRFEVCWCLQRSKLQNWSYFAMYVSVAVFGDFPMRFCGFCRNFVRFCGFSDPSGHPPLGGCRKCRRKEWIFVNILPWRRYVFSNS